MPHFEATAYGGGEDMPRHMGYIGKDGVMTIKSDEAALFTSASAAHDAMKQHNDGLPGSVSGVREI